MVTTYRGCCVISSALTVQVGPLPPGYIVYFAFDQRGNRIGVYAGESIARTCIDIYLNGPAWPVSPVG